MEYSTVKDLFTGICDAIRSKTGSTELINHQDIPSRIDAIDTGSELDTSDATATAEDILENKTAYVNGNKITGSMINQGAISKTLDTSTTSYTIPEGYHPGSGKIQIINETKTITPTKSNQTILPASGKVLSSVTVNSIPNNYVDTSDADATASNIQSGKTAYVNGEKITGTHIENSSLDTSDATAVASDILSNKTAYVNGEKITGTHECSGIDTSDATATANDIVSPQTAYVNGEKIEGSLVAQAITTTVGAANIGIDSSNYLYLKLLNTSSYGKRYLVEKGQSIILKQSAESLGDATVEDVVKGKTFTSINGLKLTGTHECSSSDSTFNLQSKSVAPSENEQIISPDSGYDGLSQVTVEAISSTYIGSGISQKSASTYTPTTSDQTITSGQYLSGAQTIKGDSNLTPENIKNGVSIFGINGTYKLSLQSKTVTPTKSSQTISPDTNYDGLSNITINPIPDNYIDTSDATATASNIQSGKTAYVNGKKITGTHTEQTSLDTSDATATSSDIVNGKTAYVNGVKITGTIQNGDEVYY